ncbi:metalloregulator ArsR/SmtB family transcription factor (plasmid) [Aliirhizobium terrae]|uniref:ArsR/SmtB family transcription factor n=1 Tax=Terrirhizobium terrae TaxID=2926709 RepID=UPI0025763B3D|nr:metalloregulator ArsR/SmtB family transcription factor [Rhizobium sp. CC-CFT758]WJH38345.1 metalloregulator ArsR/SmtB family transcription factor [Rhizobium sp. CC-CFT758]
MNAQFSFSPSSAADFIALLAHPKRLQVLELVTQREWDVTSLAEKVSLSQSALSQHLKKLRDGKLVMTRREAQTVYYSCSSAAVAVVLRALIELFAKTGTVEEMIS